MKKIKAFSELHLRRKIPNPFVLVPFPNFLKFSNADSLAEGSLAVEQEHRNILFIYLFVWGLLSCTKLRATVASGNAPHTHHSSQAVLLHQPEGVLVARSEVVALSRAHVIPGHRAHGVDHICQKGTTHKAHFSTADFQARLHR